MTTHTVESTMDTVRPGFLDPGAAPAAKIDPGDEVLYPDTWTNWQNRLRYGMSSADRARLRKEHPGCPFQIVGPVEVAGAEPGDVVECRLTELRLSDWGANAFPTRAGALPYDFDEPYFHDFRFDETRTRADYVHGISLPLDPFAGIIAVEPPGDEETSALIGGDHGGNLALPELTVGSSLFLPVAKPGARIWLGDIHALQGDGLVDQTALKSTAERLRMRYDLHKQVGLTRPLAETDTYWVGIGLADSLEAALVDCLRGLISWFSAASGVTRAEAHALCSMAASFRVTQYADQTEPHHVDVPLPPKGVHALLRKDIFPADLRARVDRWLRPAA
ncbi:acetamidase/formamidase family protein [Amycolatopsis sp. WAC 01416]|uniref:acetamidase/formamidase family protein n=1 Tax=Amycolatopsis sp. WAC 01416 TaxID=2203196 RepID=UPI000F7A803A|nr:acetamidase/formamidase family protein [Amycolatopsis sp. WAC 01416]